ncbi:Ca-activated chloride channel family protein [Gracilibacillus halotolerans]|uniref:Ca-activated chloride channel family protein n=1 Tax=Gracilibacillus halotolerans TaxID=74386 RepID=A0A841RQN7_9BACI|nr:VWA domain-containing protein [Gracilibacillus halotolerans]MBB6513686.1 Ca-activated chloride channel family protein [Gracilibacillus halotolerans]
MKRKWLLIFTVLCVAIMGCSKSDNTEAKVEANDEETEEAKKEEDDTNIFLEKLSEIDLSTDLEVIKQQQGGVLTENLAFEEEQQGNSSIEEQALKEELANLLEVTQEPEEIEKGIALLLASPNYKERIEIVENYTPDYDEPLLPDPVKQTTEGTTEKRVPPENAIILLDASSSMLLPTKDNNIRMDVAKKAVSKFAQTVGSQSDVSLVVYGHKGSESDSDKELSCTSIEEIYSLGEYEKEPFDQALSSFESRGWTPLAGAIMKAEEMTRELEGSTTIYIVSDGVETCDGDPIEAAKTFANRADSNHVHIIGFQVDQEAEMQLQEVANAGNGDYYYAENAEDIHQTIEEKWLLPSRIDVVWAHRMAPDPWEQLAEMNHVEGLADDVRTIIKQENERYKQALQILQDEELLEEETYRELKDSIEERRYSITQNLRDLESTKKTEMKDLASDIRAEIDEWVEKMSQMKEEQGDIW